jgi:hypothetical protein
MSERVAPGAFWRQLASSSPYRRSFSSISLLVAPAPLPRSNAEVVGSTSYSTNEADFKNLSSLMYYPAAPQSVRFRSALLDQGKRNIAD